MKSEYINPFIKSLINTFDTMLDCPVKRGQIQLRKNGVCLQDVSGIIGLSGKAVGSVVVSFSKSVALKAASTMLLVEATEIDDDVVDAIGEITNMVAGAAKSELEEYKLSISLPNVITGEPHGIRFPSNVQPISVPFETPWGPITLEVGLEEVPVGAGAEA